jgi:short-subunit dehydrogenase
MSKTIIIVGMGPGLSSGVAEKFGSEGYQVGMISRNAEKLEALRKEYETKNIRSAYATADVANTEELLKAIQKLIDELGWIDVLHYNAVDYRYTSLMDETVEELANGFKISVGNALASARYALPYLKKVKGAVLITGGSSGIKPNPDMASISLGKAGVRNLTLQLHEVLKKEGVFAGTVTIGGWIQHDSKTHSPKILAEKFWELNQKRDVVEIAY